MSEFIASPFTFVFDPPYHGEDGFGDANLPPISARLESEHAVNTIIRLAEQYQGCGTPSQSTCENEISRFSKNFIQ